MTSSRQDDNLKLHFRFEGNQSLNNTPLGDIKSTKR